MIQRPQSIFLLGVIVSMAAIALFPFWIKIDPATSNHYFLINAWSLTEYILYNFDDPRFPYGVLYSASFPYTLVGILTMIAAFIAVYGIFSYKHRTRQLQLGTLNTLIVVGIVVLMLYMTIQADKISFPGVAGEYKKAFFLPAIAIACNLLASYFIRKDEKLVKAADRMR